MRIRTFKASVMAAVVALSFAMPLHAQIKLKSGTEATYRAHSAEAAAVKHWLIEQTIKGDSDLALGDFDALGDMVVKVSRPYAATADSNPYPPVPLPGGGTAGSTIGITSCSRGISQEWVYMWVSGANGGGSWVLQSYSFFMRVKSCQSGA